MKLSILSFLAASLLSSAARADDWVTYTKDLGTTTMVITRYVGTSELTGTEYTTKTVVKTDSAGNPQYTEIVTGLADEVTSTTSSSASHSSETTEAPASSWVTYTKDLGSSTIIVTRYVGTEPLSGSEYTTRTVVKTDSAGNPQYTEIVTGLADEVTSTTSSSASPSSETTEAPASSWVTYTKDLGSSTIIVTRYVGTEPLSGSEYTTRTIVKTDSAGNPQYTEIVTGYADAVSTSSSASPSSETTEAPASSWVTYTKDLGSSTIIVTRYVGTEPLSGSEYTTRTVVKTDSAGNPQYTEIVTGYADSAVTSAVTSAASSSVESSKYGFTNNTSNVIVNDPSTTVITVTSCSETVCTEFPVTTGLTVITSTISGVTTQYTTYCPLTSSASTATSADQISTTVTISSASSSDAAVETYEGEAKRIGAPLCGSLAIGILALLF